MSLLKDLMTKHWFPIFLSKSKLSKIKIPGWKLLYLTGDTALMRRGDGTKKLIRFQEFGSLMLTAEQYVEWAKKQGYILEEHDAEIHLIPAD